MSWRILKDLSYWLLIVLGASAFATFLVMNLLYGYYAHEICLTLDCVNDFFRKDEHVFRIFRGAFFSITAVGVLVQLQNTRESQYLQSESLHKSNCMTHLNEFSSFIWHEMSRHNLGEEEVSAPKLHGVFFPEFSIIGNAKRPVNGVKNGNSTSDKLCSVQNFREYIEAADHGFADPGYANFEIDDHKRKVIELLAGIGIYISDLPEQAFFNKEDSVINFLNVLIALFAPNLKAIPTTRAYR